MNPDGPAARAAEIRALRADGFPVRVIADRLGVSRSRLYQILAYDRISADVQTARMRFPMLPPALAERVARGYPDVVAVCAAEDRELLSIRHMSSVKLRMLRARYPHSHAAGRRERDSPSAGETNAP